MKEEDKYGFIYIWRDNGKCKEDKSERGKLKFYIGCHWGTEDDGYICSSNWMRMSHKRRPNDFDRRILKTNILNKELLIEEENKWLGLIKKEELGKRYYNLRNGKFGHNGGTKGGNKGRQAWNKGIPATQKQKENQSRVLKEKYASG